MRSIEAQDTYFANLEGKALAESLTKLVNEFDQYMESIGRVERIKTAWEFFYGMNEGASGIKKTGKVGEIIKISVNNFRAFANNIHVLLTQAKSYFECQAENMDYKSQAECILGKSIVDYYNEEAGIGADFSQAVLDVLIFAEIFYELDWDESRGEAFAENPDTGDIENTGDVCGRLHNGLNVIRDVNLKRAKDSRWHIVRDWVDKFELAATYPEKANIILSQRPEKARNMRSGLDSIYFRIRNLRSESNNLVEVWRFYHEKTIAVKRGREALIVGGEVIFERSLTDTYDELPVKRFSASDIEGSFLAYSPLWDIIPLCQASDHMTTAQITNAINLAFTSVWSPDPKLKIEQISSGMGLVNSQMEPKALNLGRSSPELEKSIGMMRTMSQFLTGINSVAAGQPEAVSNIKSGNGLALILSTAVQFQNHIQERYADFRSGVMSLLIRILQKKATLPMLISVSGKAKARYAKSFKSDEIKSIRRVKCTLSSPIMATLGGRMQMADNLAAKYPQSVTIQQYIAVIQTGNLDHIEGGSFNEQMAILSENEALSTGEDVPVNIMENHPLHIKEHLIPISTPESKKDPAAIERMTAHIMEHFQNWQRLTFEMPALLGVIGIPPLQGPILGQPAPMPMEGEMPKDAGDAASGMPAVGEPKLPSLPSLPEQSPEGLKAAYAQTSEPQMIQ